MKTLTPTKPSPTILGELRINGTARLTGHGEGTVVSHQPDGVYLQNDGVWVRWMQPNCTYTLVRDEIGWVVTCSHWSSGHTYRLATVGQYTDQLPLRNARTVELDAAKQYELVPANGGWELHELA